MGSSQNRFIYFQKKNMAPKKLNFSPFFPNLTLRGIGLNIPKHRCKGMRDKHNWILSKERSRCKITSRHKGMTKCKYKSASRQKYKHASMSEHEHECKGVRECKMMFLCPISAHVSPPILSIAIPASTFTEHELTFISPCHLPKNLG